MPPPKSRLVLLSITLGALLGFFIVLLLPSTTPHSIGNDGANGLSKFYFSLSARTVYSMNELTGLNPEQTVLVLARQSSLKDVTPVREFTSSGGVVIAYGSPQFVVKLLRDLGVFLEFKGYVLDGVLNADSMDRILVNTSQLQVRTVFERPYALSGDFGFARVIVWSSVFAYVDLNGNRLYDLNEPIGAFPLGVEIAIGRGRVLVFFMEYLLENSVFEYNRDFFAVLADGREVVLDQSEMRLQVLSFVRTLLLYERGAISIYTVLFLTSLLIAVAYFATRE
ncbi:MAG: hypothetical protein QXJ16_01985 [Desulfurococcaceae archaeon]